MSVNSIFIDDVGRAVGKEFPRSKGIYIDEIIASLDIVEKNIILVKYANQSFKLFKSNCNLLELDICYGNDELAVKVMSKFHNYSVNNTLLIAMQKPLKGKDGKPVTQEVEITVPAFKVVSVFDVSQTEGKEQVKIRK